MITTQALDLYARIGCGQMEELIRVMTRLQLLNFNDPDYLEKVNLIRSYLDDIKRIIGLTATSSHGIHNACADAKKAYLILKWLEANEVTSWESAMISDSPNREDFDESL